MEEDSLTGAKRLIIIGGSSGSIEALLALLPLIKTQLSIPIILVLHRNNQSDTGLDELLQTKTRLKVKEADEKDGLEAGMVYIAPADYHLLIEHNKTLSLDASAKINFSRPSIDVTFISAANVYGKNLTAIILSGANADGAIGMKYADQAGGKIYVQKPDTALVSYMPNQAIASTNTQNILTIPEIAAMLNAL